MGRQADVIVPRARASLPSRILPALAVTAALAAATALGVRPLTSPDLGYHLAYGEEFLDTGRPVDTNPYIYTNPAPGDANRPPSGPGCWYDEQGRYRFANANWLTQVVMAGLWRLGGFNALCLLQAGLSAGIFLLLAAAMRQMGRGMGMPWGVVALGLLLAAMATYQRRDLRPELFGYVLLAAELTVLAGGVKSWRAVAALIALQTLFVNFHSYFLLGLLLTAAMLGDSVLRLLWARRTGTTGVSPVGPSHGPHLDRRDACPTKRQTLRYAVALAAQAAVCFLNPWTWRGAILPIETLAFLRAGGVGSVSYWEGRHPWAIIGEFANLAGPTAPAETKAVAAFYALVGLACAGAVACVVRRRWGRLAILAGMTAVAFSMRRNITPGAIVLTPVALGALLAWPGQWLRRRRPRAMRKAGVGACAAAVVLSGALAASVVSQKFYTSEDLHTRFGWGASRVWLPMDAADFLTRNRPAGRLWTDYNTCSNFHFFVRPHPDVPAVTNTWAYPPAVMGELLDYLMGGRPFEEARRRYGVETVAFFVAGFPAMARELSGDPNWRLAYVDPLYAVFLRADGPNAELAKRLEITPGRYDANRLIRQARERDPWPASTMRMAGATVYSLGWLDQSIDLFRASLSESPRGFNFRSWEMLGNSLARRGQERLLEELRLRKEDRYTDADEAHRAGRKDWVEALDCFNRAHDIRPDSVPGLIGRQNIRQQLTALERGVVLQMRYPP